MDIEERLEKLERMLRELMERIERIEHVLKSRGFFDEAETLRIAEELVLSLSTPAIVALEAAKRSIEVLRGTRLDPVSRTIIDVLSTCEELSISEITERVRRIRGSASRRIVRDRLKRLESMGIVVNLGTYLKPRYTLSRCVEK